jgi:hypothetical protein
MAVRQLLLITYEATPFRLARRTIRAMGFFQLSVFLIFLQHCSYSQKEATHWFFGFKAGLRFDETSATPVFSSSIVTQDGCAVISDKATGELLFYSNGRNVWNRTHNLMPNGQDFPRECWSSITQSALSVPYPQHPSKYYLFSIHYSKTPGGDFLIDESCNYGYPIEPLYRDLRYSVIDMALDGGSVNVVQDQKHILLQTNVTDKLTVVPMLMVRITGLLSMNLAAMVFTCTH